VARGLDVGGIAAAMALAVPAAGGVQRAFGTSAKPLQVAFAVDAGVRAADLAAAGATADPGALDAWLGLVGGVAGAVDEQPAVPGGLAVKVYPCCYALQRPIEAARDALGGRTIEHGEIAAIAVAAPSGTLQPLIHQRPATGLEGKFSLEYALAATVLDGRPGLASFSDEAVARPEARALVERVSVAAADGGEDLLSGSVSVRIALAGGEELAGTVDVPAGAPGRPLPAEELLAKVADCAGEDADRVSGLTWDGAAASRLLRW
jgi:2-methylcitrate dehydratase PrpD